MFHKAFPIPLTVYMKANFFHGYILQVIDPRIRTTTYIILAVIAFARQPLLIVLLGAKQRTSCLKWSWRSEIPPRRFCAATEATGATRRVASHGRRVRRSSSVVTSSKCVRRGNRTETGPVSGRAVRFWMKQKAVFLHKTW